MKFLYWDFRFPWNNRKEEIYLYKYIYILKLDNFFINAAIHVSRSTKDWMELKNITTMEWPARSPDINCIENLWGILARKVYEDGKHFNNKRELEIAMGTAWDELPQDIFKNLYQSMPKRMIDVLKRKGEVTKYWLVQNCFSLHLLNPIFLILKSGWGFLERLVYLKFGINNYTVII